MPLTIPQIVDSIDTRLQAAHRELSALQSAREALNGSTTPGTRPRSARRAPRIRPRTSGGTRHVVPAAKLEQLLARNDGSTTPALAKLANAQSDQVLGLLRELESAGRARRTGTRRGTRWHAITDEERIAQRTAELAKR